MFSIDYHIIHRSLVCWMFSMDFRFVRWSTICRMLSIVCVVHNYHRVWLSMLFLYSFAQTLINILSTLYFVFDFLQAFFLLFLFVSLFLVIALGSVTGFVVALVSSLIVIVALCDVIARLYCYCIIMVVFCLLLLLLYDIVVPSSTYPSLTDEASYPPRQGCTLCRSKCIVKRH